MIRHLTLSAAACAALLVAQPGGGERLEAQADRISEPRRVSFDGGWRFHRGDPAGAERPGFDDSSWRPLDLPHDWAIEGPFDLKYGPERGALPFFGVAWYRRHFKLAGAKGDRFYSIEFDGAMSNSRVWLNGHELGARPYGYIGFSFDLTRHLRPAGEENVLAVRLAPEDQSSRWYPGAGLYRHVWLDTTGPVHVARWGTYVTTPRISDDSATVNIRTTIRNRLDTPADIRLETSVIDRDNLEVARVASEPHTIPANTADTVDVSLAVVRPVRWDIDRPYLYTAVTAVRIDNAIVDRLETPFGIRAIAFDRTNGFQLNGRRVPIQGVCLHHDLGALGTAVHRRALERQLEIMKEMGANAVRTSHNPPAPELLDAADRLGLLVLDEAFDEWRKTKVENGHGRYFDTWGETDLRDMVRRDRNHPSVIMWSIGNEILEQADDDGAALARRLAQIVREEDPTRPVTAGLNQIDNAIKHRFPEALDIVGFNYGAPRYERLIEQHPEWIVLGSETASTVSSRGVYHLPLDKYEKHPSHQISSYDIIAPRWAYAPDVEFDALDRSPSVIGEFVWTGFDYLGEPTPYFGWKTAEPEKDWPARSSYFGIVDLAGFPKDRYYLYQSRWSTKPMAHIVPHWNWQGHSAGPIPVMVYTNGDEAELFLNGRSLGRRKRGVDSVKLPVGENVTPAKIFTSKYRLAWEVPWEPGTLRVEAFRNGVPVATAERRTAGPAARIRLVADRTALQADGEDLSFITVRVEDKDGILCPGADNLVRFSVRGAGEIAGVDNGNPASVESFQANRRTAFGGLALVIVRAQESPGTIRVSAASDGLAPAEVTLTTSAPRRLVWADEFDTPGLPDPARWTYDIGGHGWGNKELQFYTRARRENARVADGLLVIEARAEPWEQNAYTSARLVTKGRGDWTYGRVEVRARLPKGRGSWPAIWMLPTTTAPMKWPDDGEIDIMEHVGFNPGLVHGSIHTKRYNHVAGTQKTGTIQVPDASEAFHVYAIEWTESAIRWFVDDREYFSFPREPGGQEVWPFDAPFHLILNIAVGGMWGGQKGVDDSSLPYRMEVDYVRVYR